MAAATATAAARTVVYYDPWAAGDEGPHIRYPDQEDGAASRQRYTLRHGAAAVAADSVEEQIVRRYLENRGFDPDRFKGDDLGAKRMRCQCGFETGNAEAATSHKARWADHDIQLVH